MERPETIKVHKLKDKVVLYYIDDNTGSTQGIDLSYPAYEALKRHYDTGALEVCTDELSGLHKHIVMPRFEFTYTFTDRTDASIHTEIIEAETAEEGLNALYRKHNYRIEWRTTKELNGA